MARTSEDWSELRCVMCVTAVILLSALAALNAVGAPIRVLVWVEQQPAQKKVYTNFLGNQIAADLRNNPAFEVQSANLDEPQQGLSKERLDRTDVLIWWGHVRHDEIAQPLATDIVERIKAGRLAFLPLHSAHWAIPFRTAMEARLIQEAVKMLPVQEREKAEPEFIQWRSNVLPSRSENPRFDARLAQKENGKWHVLLERPSCVFPSCCTPMQPSTIVSMLPEHP